MRSFMDAMNGGLDMNGWGTYKAPQQPTMPTQNMPVAPSLNNPQAQAQQGGNLTQNLNQAAQQGTSISGMMGNAQGQALANYLGQGQGQGAIAGAAPNIKKIGVANG